MKSLKGSNVTNGDDDVILCKIIYIYVTFSVKKQAIGAREVRLGLPVRVSKALGIRQTPVLPMNTSDKVPSFLNS